MPNRNIDSPELAEYLRTLIPKTGKDWHKLVAVIMEAGDVIKEHKHAHHAVLHYPADSEPIIVTPTAGCSIYMPPGTLHKVPKVTQLRLSVALLADA